ncbi:MAG: shikimate kinase [Balneolaceae bacterium]
MMGSGKSTVGRLLAGRLSVPFRDLDRELEKSEGISVPEIFSRHGEDGFRRRERQLLQKISTIRPQVVALGGGSVQNREIADLLNDRGLLVFLDAPLSVLSERLQGDRSRPLLATGKGNGSGTSHRIETLMKKRRPLWLKARIRIDTNGLNPDETVEKILKELEEYDT